MKMIIMAGGKGTMISSIHHYCLILGKLYHQLI